MEGQDIPGLIKYLDRQVNKAGVEVHTGIKVTPATKVSWLPDSGIPAAHEQKYNHSR
jgi:hypothetical protein